MWKIVAVAAFAALSVSPVPAQDEFQAPEGYIPPPLHPAGVTFKTVKLSDGVYALLSSRPPVDNSGFIVGKKGVLVIDAHINAEMAGKIQEAVRKVTDKPILYLVNTTYHGDHTFGNYAFPKETKIISSAINAERMRDFEAEKKFMMVTVNNDASVFGGVKLRLPDITFERSMKIDLGGRKVEIHHFGHGNGPGDTVVYVPEAKAAWTGNFIIGRGIIPFLIEGKAGEYMKSLAKFKKTLDVERIIGGHTPRADVSIVGRYLKYLDGAIDAARKGVQQGLTPRQTWERNPLDKSWLPNGSPLNDFLKGLHRWNLTKIHGDLTK